MANSEGAAPFSRPYFDCSSQWAKVPWLARRLTTSTMSLEFVTHFLSMHRLSPVIPQRHAAPTVASACCNIAAVWSEEWFSMAVSGELLSLSNAVGRSLHSPHCPWRSQGPRVLSIGGGSPNAVLTAACAPLKVDVAGKGATWTLPLTCNPQSLEEAAAHEWGDCALQNVGRSIVAAGLRRVARRCDGLFWPHIGHDEEGGLTWVATKELTEETQRWLYGAVVGPNDLECVYCGHVTRAVEPLPDGPALNEDATMTTSGNVSPSTLTVDVLAAHHTWCLWRRTFLTLLIPAQYGSATSVTTVLQTPGAEASGAVVMIGGDSVMDPLTAAIRTAAKHLCDTTMHHPCWSYPSTAHVLAELVQQRKALSLTSRSNEVSARLKPWASTIPESSLAQCLAACSHRVLVGDKRSTRSVDDYLKFRAALFSQASPSPRKRPREDENSAGDNAVEDAPNSTEGSDMLTLQDCIRHWSAQRQSLPPRTIKAAPVKVTTGAPPSHQLQWAIIKSEVVNSAEESEREPLSAEALSRVDGFLASVRQAVVNAQVARVQPPPPAAPKTLPPATPQHHAHHKPPSHAPANPFQQQMQRGGPILPAQLQSNPPMFVPVAQHHHHHHHGPPFRQPPPFVGSQGLFDAPATAGVLSAPPMVGGVLNAPLLAPPISVFGGPAAQRQPSQPHPVLGAGGSVLGMAPRPAFANATAPAANASPQAAMAHPSHAPTPKPTAVAPSHVGGKTAAAPPSPQAGKQPTGGSSQRPPATTPQKQLGLPPGKQPPTGQHQTGKQPPPAGRGKQQHSEGNDGPQRPAALNSKQAKGPPPPPAPGKHSNNNNNNNNNSNAGNNNNNNKHQQQDRRGGRGGGGGGGGGRGGNNQRR